MIAPLDRARSTHDLHLRSDPEPDLWPSPMIAICPVGHPRRPGLLRCAGCRSTPQHQLRRATDQPLQQRTGSALSELRDRELGRCAVLRELRLRLHHGNHAPSAAGRWLARKPASTRRSQPVPLRRGPWATAASHPGRLTGWPRGGSTPPGTRLSKALIRCLQLGLPVVVPLRSKSILIGRTSRSRNIHPEIDCESDSGVSRRQTQLTTDGSRWWVEDLDSANGTFVAPATGPIPTDPIPVRGKHELAADDRIYVGAWTRIVIRRATDDEGRPWLRSRRPNATLCANTAGLRARSVAPLLQCHPRQVQLSPGGSVGGQGLVISMSRPGNRGGERWESASAVEKNDEFHRRRRRRSLRPGSTSAAARCSSSSKIVYVDPVRNARTSASVQSDLSSLRGSNSGAPHAGRACRPSVVMRRVWFSTSRENIRLIAARSMPGRSTVPVWRGQGVPVRSHTLSLAQCLANQATPPSASRPLPVDRRRWLRAPFRSRSRHGPRRPAPGAPARECPDRRTPPPRDRSRRRSHCRHRPVPGPPASPSACVRVELIERERGTASSPPRIRVQLDQPRSYCLEMGDLYGRHRCDMHLVRKGGRLACILCEPVESCQVPYAKTPRRSTAPCRYSGSETQGSATTGKPARWLRRTFMAAG